MRCPFNTMREGDVEKYLVQSVTRAGGQYRKLKWIGRRGAPDRLIMLEGPWFVEVKRPGETLEDHQQREHDRMIEHGLRCEVVSTLEEVDYLMKRIARE